MTKEEAKFERHMSRGILAEIAKALDLGNVRRFGIGKHPTTHVDYPFSVRYYGERLVIPQNNGKWDVTITITLWLGSFRVAISRARYQDGLYTGEGIELEYDAADPKFIDDIVRKYHEVQKDGPPS